MTYSDREEKEDSREEKEEREEFHSYVKYYRGSAVAFSLTIITLSGGFIYWLTNVLIDDKSSSVLPNKYFLILSLIYFGLAFLSAVSIQFLHFIGSRLLVNCMFFLFVNQQEEAYKKFRSSNDNFTRSDTAVKISFWLFVIGVIFAGLLYYQLFLSTTSYTSQ